MRSIDIKVISTESVLPITRRRCSKIKKKTIRRQGECMFVCVRACVRVRVKRFFSIRLRSRGSVITTVNFTVLEVVE